MFEFFVLGFVFIIRAFYLLCEVNFGKRELEKKRNIRDKVKTLIVIGSGGHTSEMLFLVKSLDPNKYNPRTYVMAETDNWSEKKIINVEHGVLKITNDIRNNNFKIVKIPRSREVHQDYLTSVATTLYSFIHCVFVLLVNNPDVILCNGPGTCIPICYVAFLMRVFLFSENRIVFIESVCRVRSLSLTGLLLIPIADEILVQWPELKTYPRTKYIGRM